MPARARAHAWLGAIAAVVSVGCAHGRGGPRAPRTSAPAASIHGDAITLYRDDAVVHLRVPIDAAAGASKVTITVPVHVVDGEISVTDRGGLTNALLVVPAAPGVTLESPAADSDDSDDSDDDSEDAGRDDAGGAVGSSGRGGSASATAAATADDAPLNLELDIVAPRGGHYAVEVAYVTSAISARAAYTLITTPARDRGELAGALVIFNGTHRGFPPTPVTLVDAELPPGRELADRLAAIAAPNADRPPPRALGTLALGRGETRIELLPGAITRPLRAVLVYDPIGTRLDNPGADPIRMPSLGAAPVAPEVARSYELALDPALTAGLPEGVATLAERRPDGSLAELGAATIFAAAARRARVVTIPIGTDPNVTGHREQRELTVDDGRHRLVEELALTFDNAGDRAAEVIVREHLYRGQEWSLVYYSAPAVLEGAQQIAMRITVPARGHTRLVYIVGYPL